MFIWFILNTFHWNWTKIKKVEILVQALKILFRVKHCLEKVSFYLGLGLLLYNFKSNQLSPPNPQWRSGIGDGLLSPPSGIQYLHTLFCFFSSLKVEEAYTFKNICWAEISRDLEILSRCSVKAIKNTTLCKIHMVSKGFRPMGSNAQ